MRTLDFSLPVAVLPVAVLLIAVLQVIGNGGDALRIVPELMSAVPPGSCLAVSHPAADIEPEMLAGATFVRCRTARRRNARPSSPADR